MTRIAHSHLPKMRTHRLVVDELPDEVLIYDLDRDKAHCLNRTAALVWHHCDGLTTVEQIRTKIERALGAPVDEKLVWFALTQLDRDHLLEGRVTPPVFLEGLSRRQMVRALGIGTMVAIPLITSMVAPTAEASTSCLGSAAGCTFGSQCCSGICQPAGVCQ
jgi:hypothetical protein